MARPSESEEDHRVDRPNPLRRQQAVHVLERPSAGELEHALRSPSPFNAGRTC